MVLTLQWWALEEDNSKKERNHFLVVNSCNQGSLSTYSIPEACISNWCLGERFSLCPQRSSRGIGCGSQVHKHMGAIRFLCSRAPGGCREEPGLGEAWGPSNMAAGLTFGWAVHGELGLE